MILFVLVLGPGLPFSAWIRTCGTAVVTVPDVRGGGGPAVDPGAACCLWRGGGEAGEGPAAALAGFRGEGQRGSARGVGLAGVKGAEDALVADGEQACDPQGERGHARQAAPAAGDAGGGRVLDGGEGALGAGAPAVGAPVLF